MTGDPNGEQLHLVPLDLDQQAAQLRADLDRLAALKIEGLTRALDAVASAAATSTTARERLDQAVAAARGAGATWEQIAEAAGLQRSSAWERWAHRG